jgi:hypothetical protein
VRSTPRPTIKSSLKISGLWSRWRAPIVGGNANNGSNAGPVNVNTNIAASNTNTNIGSQLCCLIIKEGPDLASRQKITIYPYGVGNLNW